MRRSRGIYKENLLITIYDLVIGDIGLGKLWAFYGVGDRLGREMNLHV